MSTVHVQNGAGVFGEGVLADSRQRGRRQMQSPKTEGRSGYWGRDEQTWLGAEGRSGTRRSIWNRVLESSEWHNDNLAVSDFGGAR